MSNVGSPSADGFRVNLYNLFCQMYYLPLKRSLEKVWFNRKASSNTGNNVLPENKGQALTHRSENNQGDNTWQMTVPESRLGGGPKVTS